MQRPEFQVASVLRRREAARDDRRVALAEAYRVDDLLRRQQLMLAEELDRLRAEFRTAAEHDLSDADRVAEIRRQEAILGAQGETLARWRKAVAAAIARRQKALVEATRILHELKKLHQYASEIAAPPRRFFAADSRAPSEETPAEADPPGSGDGPSTVRRGKRRGGPRSSHRRTPRLPRASRPATFTVALLALLARREQGFRQLDLERLGVPDPTYARGVLTFLDVLEHSRPFRLKPSFLEARERARIQQHPGSIRVFLQNQLVEACRGALHTDREPDGLTKLGTE